MPRPSRDRDHQGSPVPPGPASARRRLAITLGDPCGIGPEITARALAALPASWHRRLLVVGPLRPLLEWADRLGLALPPIRRLAVIDEDPGCVAMLPQPEEAYPPGEVSAAGGRAALRAIDAAHRAIVGGQAMAMVTNAIGKAAIRLAGDPHSGHTDLLADLCEGVETRMAMIHGRFRVVMTTLHVPYAEVPRLLTRARVATTLRLAHEAFRTRRQPAPPLLVTGLNPHAGEGGLFGREELEVIGPAIEAFRSLNPNVTGPVPADSAFRPEVRRRFAAIVAHTHDQGLIAIKAAGGLRCVNVTLGLPYVRTSVGHGTAYDRAGRGDADHRGLLAAIRVAWQLATRSDATDAGNAPLPPRLPSERHAGT